MESEHVSEDDNAVKKNNRLHGEDILKEDMNEAKIVREWSKNIESKSQDLKKLKRILLSENLFKVSVS